MDRPFKVSYGKQVGYAALILSIGIALLYLPGSPAALVWPYEWAIFFGWVGLGVIFDRAGQDQGMGLSHLGNCCSGMKRGRAGEFTPAVDGVVAAQLGCRAVFGDAAYQVETFDRADQIGGVPPGTVPVFQLGPFRERVGKVQ